MINLLKPLKNDGEHDWLYEVSNTSLQLVCGNLDTAYKFFFQKRNKFPKFKTKKNSKQTYPVRSESFYFKSDKLVNIEKIGKVKYKTDFQIPVGHKYKFSKPYVTYLLGKWILTFGMECENQVLQLNSYSMGIDLGIKDAAIVAYNNDQKIVFHNINKSKRVRTLKRKIKHIQRSISRKYESNKRGKTYMKTQNIKRQEEQCSKLYAKLTNIRHNFIHQSTHQLISLLPQRVIMEDLNVSDLLKNKFLSSYIHEQCFYEWIRQMKYKCEWRGIEFVQVPRFFPSSKTCHSCGHIKKDLKLKDRVYICPECGYTEDRDYNAALNLMSYEG